MKPASACKLDCEDCVISKTLLKTIQVRLFCFIQLFSRKNDIRTIKGLYNIYESKLHLPLTVFEIDKRKCLFCQILDLYILEISFIALCLLRDLGRAMDYYLNQIFKPKRDSM